MEKAYKFRIYPTREQQAQIRKTFGCARFVYNYYLNKRRELYKAKWHGRTFLQVGRFYPSSQLCQCGYQNADKFIHFTKDVMCDNSDIPGVENQQRGDGTPNVVG